LGYFNFIVILVFTSVANLLRFSRDVGLVFFRVARLAFLRPNLRPQVRGFKQSWTRNHAVLSS